MEGGARHWLDDNAGGASGIEVRDVQPEGPVTVSEVEVPQPIICSPFEEPDKHWHIEDGSAPTEPARGRRPVHYFYRDPGKETDEGAPTGTLIELKLVNLIRDRVKDWRRAGYPGVTATTLELLSYWRHNGRAFRPFFAQLEAVETIIFLGARIAPLINSVAR